MGVQTLEKLAFNVSYKEIVRSSLRCENHPQKGKLSPCLPFSPVLSSSRPLLSAQEKSSRVQIHLDYYLKGIVSDEIRKQFVKRFYREGFKFKHPDNDINGGHDKHCIIDICSFLDSVLDESFDQLNVVFPISGEPDPELFSIISRRSPHLKELELDFYFYYGATYCMGNLETLMGPLSSLENLTHLTLCSLEDELRQIVLSLVGKCCPLLTHLSIEGFPNWPVGEQEILRLIFGEKLSSFFPNGYNDEELDHLNLPAERLTPFCSSLRVLKYYNCSFNKGEEVKRDALSESNVAFALRHLPFLEYLGPPVPTVLGIEKLCRMKADASSLAEKTDASELVLLKDQITNIPDFLSLTKLDDVDLLEDHHLRAIKAMCPNLQHVVFTMKTLLETNPYGLSDYYFAATKDGIDPADFKEDISSTTQLIESDLIHLLNDWPKLTAIEFNTNSNTIYASIYHKTVLKVFGPNLKNLTFRSWSKGPVIADLIPCICLESLVFSNTCWSDTDVKPSTHLSAETFLPKLKHFRSSTCLGSSWSRLFEEKTSLVSLDLCCCHIGIGDEDTSPASLDQRPNKRLKLNVGVSQPWQELETLTIRQHATITPTLLNLLPRLRKLKKVVLSKDTRISTDPILLNDVMKKLTQRVSPVQIDFVFTRGCCSVLKEIERLKEKKKKKF